MTVVVRTLVARCPDWPVVALGHLLSEPVAVVHAGRVVATSPTARTHGVIPGLRRRMAEARCVDLVVRERDPAIEARTFEPVVATLDAVTPRVEVSRPGSCALATRGPARYFGGDAAVADLVVDRMSKVLKGRTAVQVGVADGAFTAAVAAQVANPLRVVEPGESPAFLAPLSIRLLDRSELTDVLVRLGIDTLGAFAGLPAADVAARFGNEGRCAHRLAAGLDERPLDIRAPSADWSVATDIDPPADRVEQVAFCARSLADRLHRRLERAGVSCVRIAIEATTEYGETLVRLWGHQGGFSAAAITDRVRWQLDGWLNEHAGSRSSGGVVRVALVADEIVAARGRQLGFWGGETEADERAIRVADHLCGRFGAHAVRIPERRGGRHPDEQISLIPAAAVELRNRRPVADGLPWPGRLPPPSPSRVPLVPPAVELLDGTGTLVGVTGRGLASASPALLVVDGLPCAVVAWAGPWPTDERWWDGEGHRRRARFQVVTDDGLARLVTLEQGQWRVTAEWD